MALKPYRYDYTEITDFFCNTVSERGGVMSLVTTTPASGSAPDSALSVVAYQGNPSGAVPVGVLWNDVVNLDLTRQHLNFQKSEVQVGSKVNLITRGTVVTNFGSGTISAGPLRLAPFGNVSNTGLAGAPLVGQALTVANEDGFFKFDIRLS